MPMTIVELPSSPVTSETRVLARANRLERRLLLRAAEEQYRSVALEAGQWALLQGTTRPVLVIDYIEAHILRMTCSWESPVSFQCECSDGKRADHSGGPQLRRCASGVVQEDRRLKLTLDAPPEPVTVTFSPG